MSYQQQRAELNNQIWKIANEVRGSVDGWDFKNYVLSILFYRFASESIETYIDKHNGEGFYRSLSDNEVSETAMNAIREEKGFYIKPSSLFLNVVVDCDMNENLNIKIDTIFKEIEDSALGTDSEEDVKSLFSDFDIRSSQLGNSVNEKNKVLCSVLRGVASIPFDEFGTHKIDLFGDAYEFLISNYAANAGKSGGEYFTPQCVSKLIAKISLLGVDKTKNIRAYDPTCGSGSLLLQVKKQAGEDSSVEFFGQEINHTTYNLARMNMFLHGVKYNKFSIKLGNTLTNPAFMEEKPFDVIVSNPPYSVKWEGNENPSLVADPRFSKAYAMAPKSKADLAFVLHQLDYLSESGRASIVCFPGIFYRGGAEQKIRKYLVENGFVEALIALPENLFFGTSISTTVLVLSRKRNEKVKFIDASALYKKETNNNILTDNDDPENPGDIQKILELFQNEEDVEYISKSVSIEDIAENDYNLSVSSYVEKEDTREKINIDELNKEIEEVVERSDLLRSRINDLIKEM